MHGFIYCRYFEDLNIYNLLLSMLEIINLLENNTEMWAA